MVLEIKHPLLDLLHIGEENARKGKELGAHFGSDDAGVREMVNGLRKQGIPICSSRNGYYMPASDMEGAICGRSLRARAFDILAVAKIFTQFENDSENGQLLLDEELPATHDGE